MADYTVVWALETEPTPLALSLALLYIRHFIQETGMLGSLK